MFETLHKFFEFCREEDRRKFKISIVLGVIAAFFSTLKIPAIAVVIDGILNNTLSAKTSWISFVIMLISVLGSCIIKYKSTMLQTEAGYTTAANKRIEIAEHMRYLPMGYFNNNSVGKIMSVTTNTMENLSDVGTRVVMLVTEGVITTLAITIMILFYDYRVALLLFAGILMFYGINTAMQKSSTKIAQQKVKADATLVEKVLEYIHGIAEVKSYHLVGQYNQDIQNAVDENVDANIQMELKLIPYTNLQTIVAKLIGVAVCLLSLFLYTANGMTLLNCIMFVICSFMILEGLERAGMYSTLLRVIDTCVNKGNEILELPAMDIEGEDVTPSSFDLEAKNITFAYEQKKVIDAVSLSIPQNTTTAFVGPSGSGKTTLCHLLSRFWDVDTGEVLLGGKDIKEYSLDALMKNFSFVFQNVYLFKDTIANNIRFGKPEATMEEVIAVAKKAKCHDFITALPNGYDTVIGESGSSLSGGEKQRLSIARAMMKDAPIIILDEATANVDPENEKDLLEAIKALTRQKTIIMIAHRLKTVRDADKIIAVDAGKIVQEGTHEQLLQEEGIYKDFISERAEAVCWKI